MSWPVDLFWKVSIKTKKKQKNTHNRSDCVPTSQKNYHWELLFFFFFFSNIHQRTTFSAKVWKHWMTLFNPPANEWRLDMNGLHSLHWNWIFCWLFYLCVTISEVWTSVSAIRNLLTWEPYRVSSVGAFSQQPRTGVIFPSADMFVMSLIHICQSHVGGWM